MRSNKRRSYSLVEQTLVSSIAFVSILERFNKTYLSLGSVYGGGAEEEEGVGAVGRRHFVLHRSDIQNMCAKAMLFSF